MSFTVTAAASGPRGGISLSIEVAFFSFDDLLKENA